MYDIIELNSFEITELRAIAKKLGVLNVQGLTKQENIFSILDKQALMKEEEVEKNSSEESPPLICKRRPD